MAKIKNLTPKALKINIWCKKSSKPPENQMASL